MNSANVGLWTEVERAADQLVRVITTTRVKLTSIERDVIDRMASVSQDGQRCLSAARRILRAVETRLNTINSYIQHGSEGDLRAAARLAHAPLILSNDSVNKLISEDDIPPIELGSVQPTLEHLLARIVVQKQRVVF